MYGLQLFKNPEFGEIRTVEINGEGWLVGKEVATALGYSNASKAVMVHVDDEDKMKMMLNAAHSQNGNVVTETTIINESGLYSLALSSKLPTAKKFRRWVTSEVLSSIRSTGGYIAGQEQMSDSELMAKALLLAQKQIEQRNAKIAEQEKQLEAQQSAVDYVEFCSTSKQSISIGEFATILTTKGINIGQNRLFKYLVDNHILRVKVYERWSDKDKCIKKENEYWVNQRYLEAGNFSQGLRDVPQGPGKPPIKRNKVKLTVKGQKWLYNRLKKENKQSELPLAM